MRITYIMLPLLLLTACTKEKNKTTSEPCIYECDEIPMNVQIDAGYYTPEEMDTVIVKKYVGDGTFTTMQHTSTRVFTDTGQYELRDALVFDDIYSGTDYEVLIPGAGQTYRIWGVVHVSRTVTFTGANCNSGHFQCYEALKECSVSGGNYEVRPLPGGATTIKLKH